MDSEVNITPPIQPEPTPSQLKPKFRPVVLWVVLGAAIAGYFTSAYYFNLYPFEQSNLPILTFTPRPSQVPTQSAPDTSTWKTYTNTKYGFEFKYPSSWRTNGPELVNYGYQEPKGSPIEKFGNMEKNLQTNEPADYTPYSENDLDGLSKKKILIDGFWATQGKITNPIFGQCCTLVTLFDKNYLHFDFWTFYDAQTEKKYSADHNQILSTFKFTGN